MGWRRGLIMGGDTCGALSEPYVLWDSRLWNGLDSIGTGVRAMPNLGIGGSDWDLDISTRILWDGRTVTWANQNASTWTTFPAITWDSVGGLPCEGPFTFMVAYGDFPDPNTHYAEVDMLFRNGGGYGLAQAIGYMDTGFGAPADAVDYSSFVAPFHGFAYTQWNAPYVPTAGNASTLFRNKLISVTVDGVKDKFHKAYRGSDSAPPFKILPHNFNDEQEEFFEYADPGNCEEFDGSGVYLDGEHFLYFGEDVRTGGVSPGTPWTGVVGAALFRGCPSPADIDYWHDYFYGSAPSPLPPWSNPYSYSGGFARWTDGTYAYYDFRSAGSLVPIPGQPLPTNIDIFLVGGGGGSNGFVTPAGGAGGGGGEVIQATVAAPVVSQAFTLGAAGPSRTTGGSSTFMGYTARGGRGTVSSTGGANGDPFILGGTRLVDERAGGGGGGAGGAGGNVSGTLTGKGGPGIPCDWGYGGDTIYFGAGGNGGGNIGSVTQAPPDDGGGSNNSPAPTPNSGGGAGGRIANAGSAGFTASAGRLLIRHLLA